MSSRAAALAQRASSPRSSARRSSRQRASKDGEISQDAGASVEALEEPSDGPSGPKSARASQPPRSEAHSESSHDDEADDGPRPRRGRPRGQRGRPAPAPSGGSSLERVLQERASRSPSSSVSSVTSTSKVNGVAPSRRSARVPGWPAALRDDSASRESSGPTSAVEVSDDSVDEADEILELNGSTARRRLKCQLCGALVANRSRLKKHALVKHFRPEVGRDLPQIKPFKCPFKRCHFEATSHPSLQRHYESMHDIMEKFMTQVESITDASRTNGAHASPENNENCDPESSAIPSESHGPVSPSLPRLATGDEPESHAHDEDASGGVIYIRPPPGPPQPPLDTDQPQDFEDFQRQVHDNLKTLKGSRARALDERSIECVCGQTLRLDHSLHWQYLIQKPYIREGLVVQKGHWFTCDTVLSEGSFIPQYKISEEELAKPPGSTAAQKCAPASEDIILLEGEKRRSKRMIDRDGEEQPARKKSKDEPDEEAHFNLEQHIRDLLATRVPGEIFLQDGPCFQMGFDVAMCHMCRSMPNYERKDLVTKGNFDDESCDISCCFYAFRKLKYSKGGQVCVAGYLDPQKDPKPQDIQLWSINPDHKPDIPIDKVKYILGLIGDQFCDMIQQERKCLSLNISDNKTTVWKPAVRGVREMCDVCKTTLFNFHWTCGRCGIFVCLDCYQFRKTGLVKEHLDRKSDDTDEYDWPMCNSGEPHCMEKMVMAQIIPKKCLLDLSKLLHTAREKWNITQFCHSPDEFAELFSDEGFRSFGDRTSIRRAAKLFPCPFCEDITFKWQYELYKHCVFVHFRDKIRTALPDQYPATCPKCEYLAKNRSSLALHFGITHRIVVAFIEEAVKNPEALPKPPIFPYPKTGLPQPFKCPMCPLSVSASMKEYHLCSHFQDLLLKELPTQVPFTCPKCRFVAMDSPALVHHFGVFHKYVQKYYKQYLEANGQEPDGDTDFQEIDSISSLTPNVSDLDCRLCESLPSMRGVNELYKHLSEAHFKERLIKETPDQGGEEKLIKCNKDQCDYTAVAKVSLLNHLGIQHRLAVKFYYELLGIDADWQTAELPSPTRRNSLQSQSLSTICGFCKETFLADDLLLHIANSHFPDKTALLAKDAPFKCSMCPHFSVSHKKLLEHFGYFHRVFIPEGGSDELELKQEIKVEINGPNDLDDGFKDEFMSETTPSVEDESSAKDNSRKTPGEDVKCLMCDDCRVVGSLNGDLMKHLIDTHFKERLKKAVKVVQGTDGKRRYFCPECSYDNQFPHAVAKHYGAKHKVVKQWYNEVIGFKEPPPLPPVSVSRRPQQQAAPQSHPKPNFSNHLVPTSSSGCPQPPRQHHTRPFQVQERFDQTQLTMDPRHPPGPGEAPCPPVHQPLVARPPQQPPANHPGNNISHEMNLAQSMQHVLKATTTTQPHQAPQYQHQQQYGSYNQNSQSQVQTYSQTPHQAGVNSFPNQQPQPPQLQQQSQQYQQPNVPAFVCKICSHNSKDRQDYLHHLALSHYIQKLLAQVPQIGPPFKCPHQGCPNQTNDKMSMAMHYGVFHQIVLYYLNEEPSQLPNRGIQSQSVLPTQASHPTSQTHAPPQQSHQSHGRPQLPAPPIPSQGIPPQQPPSHADVPTASVPPPGFSNNLVGGNPPQVITQLLAQTPSQTPQLPQIPVAPSVSQRKPAPNSAVEPVAKKAKSGGAHLPPYKAMAEDKKFPKCKLCSYRYFTRLDLCRHFVDNHLRHILTTVLPPDLRSCPACNVVYENRQTLLRHFIWSHQDLEKMVVSQNNLKLSEFTPTSRDLDIMKMRTEQRQGIVGSDAKPEFKDLSDLSLLPVHANVDSKCTIPTCELCGEEFTTSVNKVRDKGVHLLSHFREQVLEVLPCSSPYFCRECPYKGRDVMDLCRHFGLSHKYVFSLMQKELGDSWALDEVEKHDCKICQQVFMNGRALNDHYCDGHFYATISEGLARDPPFKCTKCSSESKSFPALVRHFGSKHKMVKTLLAPYVSEPTGKKKKPTKKAKDTKAVAASSQPQPNKNINPTSIKDIRNPLPPGNGLPQHPLPPPLGTIVAQRQPAPGIIPGPRGPSPYPQGAVNPILPQHPHFGAVQRQALPQQLHAPSHNGNGPHGQQYHQPAPNAVGGQYTNQAQPQYQANQFQASQPQQQYNPMHAQGNQPNAPPGQSSPYPPQVAPQYHQPPSQTPNQPSYQYHGVNPSIVAPPHQQHPPVASNSTPQALANTSQQQQQQQASQAKPKTQKKPDAAASGSGNNTPSPIACPHCSHTFLNATHFIRHASDKHFSDQMKQELPELPPFKCPACQTFAGKDLKMLVRHYGLTHNIVVRILNENAGRPNCYDDSILKQYETSEANRESCPLCKNHFSGRYMLLRHLADCHYRERLCEGLPSGSDVYKCPSCSHESKDKGGFVRHFGLVHKMVQKYLGEEGVVLEEPNKKPPSRTASQTPNSDIEHSMSNDAYQFPQAGAESHPLAYTSPLEVNVNQPHSIGSMHYSQPSSASQSPHQSQMMSPSVRSLSRSSLEQAGYAQPQGNYYNTGSDGMMTSPYSSQGSQQATPNAMDIKSPQQFHNQQPMSVPPRTPQTPGSQGAGTPQPPMTPQERPMSTHSSSFSTGVVSPGPSQFQVMPQHDSNQPGYPLTVQHQQQQQFPTQAPAQYPQQRPVILQQQPQPTQLPPAASAQPPQSSSKSKAVAAPAADPFIEAPEPGMERPYLIKCLTCGNMAKNKSDFFRHMSERHYKSQLAAELPSEPPWKCPVGGCTYETNDKHISPLVKHYGIVHKMVQKFLNGVAGKYVPSNWKTQEAKAGSSQPKQVVQAPLTPQQPNPVASPALPVQHPHPAQSPSAYTTYQSQPIPHATPQLASQHQYQQQQPQPSPQIPIPTPSHPTGGPMTMSNQALKVKCPFCDMMFSARYTFHQHLCDKHFKDTLAAQVPPHAPWKCPSCDYIAKDSKQSLVRHYGMTHKVVIDLLKQSIPGYTGDDQFRQEDPRQQQQALQQQQAQQQQAQQQQVQQQQQQAQLHPQQHHMHPPQHPHQQPAPQHHPEAAPPVLHPPPPGPQHHLPHPSQQMHHHPQHAQAHHHQPASQHPNHYYQDTRHPLPPQHHPQALPYHHQMAPVNAAPPPPTHHQPGVGGGLPPMNNFYPQAGSEYHHPHQQPHHPPHHDLGGHYAGDLRFDHQMDGTYDPSLASEHSLEDIRSLPTTPAKSESALSALSDISSTPGQALVFDEIQPPPIQSEVKTRVTSSRICELCGKIFEGKNRSMLRVQHLSLHFKEQIFGQLPTQKPPYPCPVESCSYQTKHKPDWARHYGSVHKFLDKYITQYFEENPTAVRYSYSATGNPSTSNSLEPMNGAKPNMDEIFSTAMSQQNLSNLDLSESHEHLDLLDPILGEIIKEEPFADLNIDDLNVPMLQSHLDLIKDIKTEDDDLAILSSADLDASLAIPTITLQHLEAQSNNSTTFGPKSVNDVLLDKGKSPGRPCELCGFTPKTKNRSRERFDHLAKVHFRKEIEADLATNDKNKCPLCAFTSKDRQTIYRHYIGTHRIIEKYLCLSLSNGTRHQHQAERSENQSHGEVDGIKLEPIMQVDGLVDDLEEEPEMDSDVCQVDGNDDEDDIHGGKMLLDVNCPLCGKETRNHKTYHLATNHFKEKLRLLLPTERPFRCTKCNYEAKTKINMWTHFMGKHRYTKLWIEEALAIQNGTPLPTPQPECRPMDTVSPIHPPPEMPTPPLLGNLATSASPEIKVEIKTEVMPLQPDIEIKAEFMSDVSNMSDASITEQTPGTPTAKGTTPRKYELDIATHSVRIRSDFWCDLCQKMLTQTGKAQHFAVAHFEDKLKEILPETKPHLCSFCRFEAKSFQNLGTHYLSKHNVLNDWIRQGLLELEAKTAANRVEDEKVKTETSLEVAPTKREYPSSDEVSTEEDESWIDEEEQSEFSKKLFNLLADAAPRVRKVRRKRQKTFKSFQDVINLRPDPEVENDQIVGDISRRSRDPVPARMMTIGVSSKRHHKVPHYWLCDGRLLVLTDPAHEDNVHIFKEQWIRGQPVVVSNVSQRLNIEGLWSPEAFSDQFGHIKHDIVNTFSGKSIPKVPLRAFWDGFQSLEERLKDAEGRPMLMKLKDWPPDNDFAAYLPDRFNDLMKCIPLQDYTLREGRLNLASCIPDFFVRPDLGPKMYIAYGNALYPQTGTTNLHIDMSDACNLMVYVGIPKDGDYQDHINLGLRAVDESDCDMATRERVRGKGALIGAIWHIYHPRDADKIRDMLNKVAIGKRQRIEPNTDPIHDQSIYLDGKLRKRLFEEYGVVGYAYPQCEGDTVFIPAGAPHQVRNVHNCIKVAEDFVTPENLEWCFYQTEEFRHLSDTHTNHEDKLQIKNILFHAVKDCLSVLAAHELEDEREKKESQEKETKSEEVENPIQDGDKNPIQEQDENPQEHDKDRGESKDRKKENPPAEDVKMEPVECQEAPSVAPKEAET